ncbi:hypothetical protein DVB69_01530 [Sporosarcina sp. BI001-red]|uniref:hypothetical protein n=1 Tax=Sporosarcina sp. BI001-red TaxID=2282866 RepID=UPI000E251188|nr:hypothetical protein [Sporosarcina sp. BI001-red]REB10983.1 hypothetical protein DVB69_01530 [Sporosarcina sp. BI001-red]
MVNSKSTVVSIRVNDDTLNKLQEIQNLLKVKTNTETTQGVLFANMIALYHKYLNDLDKDEQDAFIKAQLVKALTELPTNGITTTEA